MKIEDFKTAAKAIQEDPLIRLSQVTKDVIARNNYVYDAHIHIFDRKCAPILYYALRFIAGGNRQNIYEVLEDDAKFSKVEGMSDEAFQKSLNNESNSNKEVIKVVLKKNQSQIFDHFNENFALNNFEPFKNKESIAVVLSMDLESGWGRKTRRSFKEQIEDLHGIAEQKAMLPFFALDPRRADESGADNLYEMFIKAFTHQKAPFFGVKCYPALGYLPSDARLAPIFQVCNEKNIPVVTHCGGNVVSTFKKEIIAVNSEGKSISIRLPTKDRDARASYLNDPLHWDSVLNKYDKLKINFAHFGGSVAWSSDNELDKIRIEQILERMSRYESRVFTDFSFNLVHSKAINSLKERFSDPLIKNRTMYGTDYWVVLPKNDLKAAITNYISIMGNDMFDMANTVPDTFLFGRDLIGDSLTDIIAGINQ
ncbi:MAG: amidohydrolase family protein [Leadbetterella sp.]